MSFEQVQRNIYLVQAALESPEFVAQNTPFNGILDSIDKVAKKPYSTPCILCKEAKIPDCKVCAFFNRPERPTTNKKVKH